MFGLFYTFLYINDVKKRIHILSKPQRSSLRIHLCASERSERAIFGVFNSFTVKNVSFFTINVIFKVILSSKSGGGMFVQAIPPPKKVGGGGDTSPTPPPRDLRQWYEEYVCHNRSTPLTKRLKQCDHNIIHSHNKYIFTDREVISYQVIYVWSYDRIKVCHIFFVTCYLYFSSFNRQYLKVVQIDIL